MTSSTTACFFAAIILAACMLSTVIFCGCGAEVAATSAGQLPADEGSRQLSEADLAIVKQRMLSLLRGGDGQGQYRQLAMERLAEDAQQLMSRPPQTLAWDDPEDPNFVRGLMRYAADTRRLAEAWGSPHNRYYHDDQVLARVLHDFEHMLTHFNPDTPRPGNWHSWLIVMPERLGATALLVEEALPGELRQQLEEALDAQLAQMHLGGANAAWEARNHTLLALLQNDPVRLAAAAEVALRTVRLTSDGGIREDYGYMYHGHIPYAGGYGIGFAHTVSQFMYLLDGTRWTAGPEQRQMMANLLLEHFRWFSVKGTWDINVRGRIYESPGSSGALLDSMLFMTSVQNPRQDDLRAASAAFIAEGYAPSAGLADLADAIADVAPQAVSGFRYWYTCDMGAYRGKDYHVSFRQYSRRVQDYEYLNRQGPKGWNLAYGFTYITRTGREIYRQAEGRSLVDLYDWQRLPGTTSRIGAHPENHPDGPETGHSLNYGRSQFSGGAGLDDVGVAAFILMPAYGQFEARKSLTFFPGGYLAMGSAITSTAAPEERRPVQTTILQWAAEDATVPLLLDNGDRPHLTEEPQLLRGVNWCFIDNVGVIFYEPTDIYARRAGPITTLWLDHGPAPQDAGYAFAVLPNSTIDEVREFVEARQISPVQRNRGVHVAKIHDVLANSVVVFEPDAVADLPDSFANLVDAPMIACMQAKGDAAYAPFNFEGEILMLLQYNVDIAVQNPLHSRATLTLTLPLEEMKPVFLSPDREVRLSNITMPAAGGDPVKPSVTVAIDTLLGRIYRLNIGGGEVQSVPRENLEELYAFSVEADSNPAETILNVRAAEQLLQAADYRLQINGFKGHPIAQLGKADIFDRPAPGLTRYRWRRSDGAPAASAATIRSQQREGDFRLILRTGQFEAVTYFTVPRFDADGTPGYPPDLPQDRNKYPQPPVDVGLPQVTDR